MQEESKEMKALNEIGNTNLGENPYISFEEDKSKNVLKEDYEIVEQALKDKQELERFTRLVIEKCIKIQLVCVVGEVEQYNQTYVYDNMLNVKWCLTKDEFNFAKEMVEKYGEK